MRVLATDRDLDGLLGVAFAAAWPMDRVFLARLDVTSAADWEKVFQLAEEKLGKLDLLFNVAGVMRAEWVQDTPLEDIDLVVDVDLKGVMLGTRFAARNMIQAGSGHIVNVSSMLALAPGPGLSVYTGAKYGVRGFTLSAALELKDHGVAVTLVCPDKVETGLFGFPNAHGPQAAIAWSGPDSISPDEVAHAIVRDVLRRRPLVYCIPRSRGFMARCSELVPSSMMRGMYSLLSAEGMRKQREQAADKSRALASPSLQTPRIMETKRVKQLPSQGILSVSAVSADCGRDTDEIYASARAAATGLRFTAIETRMAWIRRIKEFLLEDRDDLAREIARESGKSISEVLVQELAFVIATMEYDLRHARKALQPERVERPLFHFLKQSAIHYEPLGVVLVLSPYNYPLALGLLPAVEAVLTGNAVILKPSERCPLTTIWAKLLQAADLPAGVLQVCHGGPVLAGKLIDAAPDHIHLTGGSETGAKVAELAARKLISVSAELGGKDVAIVFADAAIDRAIECLVWAFLVNQGQTCASIKRLLVHESIYDSFLARFTARLANLTREPGNGSGSEWTWDAPPFRATEAGAWITAALSSGAKVLFPPHPADSLSLLSGLLSPVVVGNVTPGMRLWQQETWGPLLAVASFSNESEAISMANDCRFGLGASVWSNDTALAKRVAAAMNVGFVSINNALSTLTNPALPYGGCKTSGWGRTRGRFGLRAFCNVKSVTTDRGRHMEPYWLPHTASKTRMFSKLLGGAFGKGFASKWGAFKAAGYLARISRRGSDTRQS